MLLFAILSAPAALLAGWLVAAGIADHLSRPELATDVDEPLPEGLPSGWVVETFDPHHIMHASSATSARRRAALMRDQGREAFARPWINTPVLNNTAELALLLPAQRTARDH